MKSILIADDRKEFRIICKTLIMYKKGSSTKIDVVNNGWNLIQKAKDKNYSLILSDNGMGEGPTGLESIQEIRKYKKDIPIFLMSVDKELKYEYKKSGATGFLNKNDIKFIKKLEEVIDEYL